MKPSEVLDKSADLLSKPWRWTQGSFSKKPAPFLPTRYCASGALMAVRDSVPGYLDAYHYLGDLIESGSIEAWNDDPKRTREEVVATLRKAAVRAREDGR